MTESFDEERARAFTIESLRHAGTTLLANEPMCRELVMEVLGAPGEGEAQAFLNRVQMLLGLVAGRVECGIILDASRKPSNPSTEVH